jgi:hypothetical protein
VVRDVVAHVQRRIGHGAHHVLERLHWRPSCGDAGSVVVCRLVAAEDGRRMRTPAPVRVSVFWFTVLSVPDGIDT